MPFASGLYGSIKSSIRASVRNSIRGVDSSCNVYLFSSANTDKLTFVAPFTGNIKVILAANAETGIHPDIISGRQNLFEESTDPVNEPNWVQYEADVTSLAYIVDETFDGVVGRFALDDVWYDVDMG